MTSSSVTYYHYVTKRAYDEIEQTGKTHFSKPFLTSVCQDMKVSAPTIMARSDYSKEENLDYKVNFICNHAAKM